MSTALVSKEVEWTPEQVALITSTVAKGATPDELKLFLYRCKNMGLDPLKPGNVHFIKYNAGTPGTMVIGIDGFRSKAAKTGKHTGTKRGIVRDEKGKCLGAWAEVYRSDWSQPAREEVSLAEYSTGKSMWAKMPETMIKKVAEVAALRMAFADDLGGMYSDDEMEQADPHHRVLPPAETTPAPPEPKKLKAEAKIIEAEIVNGGALDVARAFPKPYGMGKGKPLSSFDLDFIAKDVAFWENKAASQGEVIKGKLKEYIDHAKLLLGVTPFPDDDIPF